jgi:23S rRNA pseudouridine1911/1915/1917 synthase
VLYEDNHIIVLNKRPGEIVQGDKTGDEPLSEKVKAYIKESFNKPGEVFIGVVHRIDRPVSGAVIFARTGKALARLNQMLKDREIRKVYWAVVAADSRQSAVGSRQSDKSSNHVILRAKPEEPAKNLRAKPEEPAKNLRAKPEEPAKNLKAKPEESSSPAGDWIYLTHFLKRNEKQNKSYPFDLPGPGRVKAEMKYRKVASSDRYDLLEVELITGRHHQIRVQMAAAGMPIRGDLKYGYPRSNPDGSINLHARHVGFIHPVRKTPVNIIAPPPDETLWNYFSGIISQ